MLIIQLKDNVVVVNRRVLVRAAFLLLHHHACAARKSTHGVERTAGSNGVARHHGTAAATTCTRKAGKVTTEITGQERWSTPTACREINHSDTHNSLLSILVFVCQETTETSLLLLLAVNQRHEFLREA